MERRLVKPKVSSVCPLLSYQNPDDRIQYLHLKT